jgi:ABC-type multidrug transport system permease subunit
MRMTMSDIIEKTSIGTLGFFSSVGIAEVNAILSALVAIMTIVYLGVSIYKKIK